MTDKDNKVPIRTIVVEDYNPEWAENFQKIKSELWNVMKDFAISIEHVGSTSVPGLAAKPIIDIDIVIPRKEDLLEAIRRLETIGYFHEGDGGIIGREMFGYQGKQDLQQHNMYVCAKDSEELHRHVTFRDYLRLHPEDVNRYGEIKKEAAQLHPHDIDAYINHKSKVVTEIYRKLGI